MIGALIARRKASEGLEALNKRDLEVFLKDWADDATFTYPGDLSGVSGTHTA